MTRSRKLCSGSISVLVTVLAAGCGSQASSGPAAQGKQAAVSTVATTGPGTKASDGGAPTAGASDSSTAPAIGTTSGSAPAAPHPSSAAPLPASAKGDHQKVVDLMASVGDSHLPIHRTASLGSAAKFYQVTAAKYRDVLIDLSATGYGDAESSANTYILILGQLKPVAPLPDLVDGTLAAMGAHGVVAKTALGAHAAASSLVMSCGDLASGYSVCVWMGGTGGDLFMGAFEAPPGTGIDETAVISESVFGYVAP